MNKKCVLYKSSCDYNSTLNRSVYIDMENAQEIFKSIEGKEKKFKAIIERILTQKNMYYDHYGKEKINDRAKNITAIKFHDKDNTRIYCKEIKTTNGTLCILCAKSLNKKVQKNNKAINEIINSIINLEYEI